LTIDGENKAEWKPDPLLVTSMNGEEMLVFAEKKPFVVVAEPEFEFELVSFVDNEEGTSVFKERREEEGLPNPNADAFIWELKSVLFLSGC
jgi:hypothetical protein